MHKKIVLETMVVCN